MFLTCLRKKHACLILKKTLSYPCQEKGSERIRLGGRLGSILGHPASHSGGWCNRCGHGRFWVGEVTGWVRWLWCVPKVAIFWWGKNFLADFDMTNPWNGWNWLAPFHNAWQKNPQKWSFLLPFFCRIRFFVGIFPKEISRIIFFVFSVSFRILAYWDSNKKAGTSLSFPYPARCPIQATGVIIAEGVVRVGGVVQSEGFPKQHCFFIRQWLWGFRFPRWS